MKIFYPKEPGWQKYPNLIVNLTKLAKGMGIRILA